MTTTKSNSAAVAFKVSAITKSEMDDMLRAGIIKDSFIQIKSGTFADFDIVDESSSAVPSFKVKGETINMPKYVFQNSETRFTVWGSTLLNAIVLKDYSIRTDAVKAADGLPVYFRDEFMAEFPTAKKVSDIRNDDGGVTLSSKYKIIGAIVQRSTIDSKRWAVNYKQYEHGVNFLAFARIADPTLNWISEDAIVAIASKDKVDRTFKSANGDVVLPSDDRLKILNNADTDPRWASAQFIVAEL
jgi:hypothetical protein